MMLYQINVIICILSGLHVGLHAYPMVGIPFFLSPGGQRYKKSSLSIQPDVDVLELESLKQNDDEYNLNESQKSLIFDSYNSRTAENTDSPGIESELKNSSFDKTTALSVTLDSTSSSMINPVNNQRAPQKDIIKAEQSIQYPPILHHNDSTKANTGEISNPASEQQINTNAALSSKAKPFHGAARLAFGQNPEVLPTTVSSTSTSTTENTITTLHENLEPRKESLVTTNPTIQNPGSIEKDQLKIPLNFDEIMSKKEAIGGIRKADDLVTVLKSTERRSITAIVPKASDDLLLKQSGAGYSSFDLAQYIFWTGDETGVAHAIEDLIQNGTLTRESALTFLRDVRLGIQYLQQSYNNRIALQPNFHDNGNKKSYLLTSSQFLPRMHTPSTEQSNIHFKEKFTQNKELWNKFYELDSDATKVTTVKDIVYKLAKIMFEESLARGPDETQTELQKITGFLERGAQQGIIPLDLQKQILHILFRALSDTFNEHPELLPATHFGSTQNNGHLPDDRFN